MSNGSEWTENSGFDQLLARFLAISLFHFHTFGGLCNSHVSFLMEANAIFSTCTHREVKKKIWKIMFASKKCAFAVRTNTIFLKNPQCARTNESGVARVMQATWDRNSILYKGKTAAQLKLWFWRLYRVWKEWCYLVLEVEGHHQLIPICRLILQNIWMSLCWRSKSYTIAIQTL